MYTIIQLQQFREIICIDRYRICFDFRTENIIKQQLGQKTLLRLMTIVEPFQVQLICTG